MCDHTNQKEVQEVMCKARDQFFNTIRGNVLAKGFVLDKKASKEISVYSKRAGSKLSYLFETTVSTPKEMILKCLTDFNYMKIWDAQLEAMDETAFTENLTIRNASYANTQVSKDPLVLRTGNFWGVPEDDSKSVFMVFQTLSSKDEIFPDPMQIPVSGLYCTTQGDNKTLVRYIISILLENQLSSEGDAGMAGDLFMWFKNLIRAGEVVLDRGNQPSFQIPNRGSMEFDFDNVVSSVSLAQNSSWPKMPSFSGLSLPVVAERNSLPRAPKQIDVVLPQGKTLRDYWTQCFENVSSPLVIATHDLEKVEFANLAFHILMGSQSKNGERTLGSILSEGDMLFLKQQMGAIVKQQITFFAHAFTFKVNDQAAPTIMVAEANCSGCFTHNGWYLVIELRPIFTKKMGVLTPKMNFPECQRFDSFFENSPHPAAMILPSGYILCVNTAFCSFLNTELKNSIVGEHVSSVLNHHQSVSNQVAAAISLLSGTWFSKPDQKSVTLENGFGSVECLSFFRGTNIHHDNLKCFQLNLYAQETLLVKRRKMSLSN